VPSITFEYRRAHVAGLWVVATGALFLCVGAALSATGVAVPWGWAAAVAVLAVLPGLLWDQWFDSGVWLWNGAVRRLASLMRRYVLAVSYYTLVVPLAPLGSPLGDALAAGAGSRWVTRRPNGLEQARGLAGFAREPRNRWAACLFPLVFLLRVFRDEYQETAPPASTYTLY
jgi:hypothetical protein